MLLLSSIDTVAQNKEHTLTVVPNDNVLLTLVYNTIITINDANLSGNYTVLRDLCAPILASKTSSVTFSDSFSSIRAKEADLSAVILSTPKLKSKATIDEYGVLRLSGFYPTTPLQVHFNFGYMKIGQRWRLAAVQVDLLPPGSANFNTKQELRDQGSAAAQKPRKTK